MPNRNDSLQASEIIHSAARFLSKEVRSYTTSSFFKPYKGRRDVALTIASPIYAPLTWGLLGLASATATVVCALASVGYLLGAGGAAVCGKKEDASNCFSSFVQLAILSAASAALTPLLLLVAAISLPENLVKIFSRASASAYKAISGQSHEEPSAEYVF